MGLAQLGERATLHTVRWPSRLPVIGRCPQTPVFTRALVYQTEYSEWQQRPIEDEIVYLWLDDVYLKARLEKEKAALLVAIGVKADGHKAVLAVSTGYRGSTASWSNLLRDPSS